MNIQNFVKLCPFILKILSKNQSLKSTKGNNSVVNLQKKILSVIMCIQNLFSICLFILKILSKNQILTSTKDRNSICEFARKMIYNTNVDLVNDNVYTKFGLNQSIRFQDIEQKKQILTSINGRNSVANLRETKIYNTDVDLANDNVYTNFGLNRPIRFQDIEQKLNSDVNQGL